MIMPEGQLKSGQVSEQLMKVVDWLIKMHIHQNTSRRQPATIKMEKLTVFFTMMAEKWITNMIRTETSIKKLQRRMIQKAL
ncbi:MAG: hypothetical protein BWY74_03613 [Firmicutes bacterium ADurb.Bin419]|nr:MAG: hypothetical protein BWY74_03613 [Firmicutes bacterium ADurb.Bin419]